MNKPNVEDLERQYRLPDIGAERVESEMIAGLRYAQEGYVGTVVAAARRKGTANVAAAQSAMAEKAGPQKMLAGPMAMGGPDHAVSRTLREVAFYPEHNARKESRQYAQVHHQLVVFQDLPCLSCGVRQSTLDDPKQNPYGAKQMETHHHVVEWALANALDIDKFNARIVPALARRHPLDLQYKHPFTEQQMLDWVDHSADNLWVLCDVHHRHVYLGIHAVTDPIWGPVDIVKDEFLTQGFLEIAKGVMPSVRGERTDAKEARRSGACGNNGCSSAQKDSSK